MKTLQFALRATAAVCFAFMMSSASCNLSDKVDDIKFDAKLPLEFPINEEAISSAPKSYNYTKTLDATQNADVVKYKDKIKEFKVNKIAYVISGYSAPGGAVTFTNGTLSIASSGKTIASATSVNLQSTAETELTADTAGFNELAELLKADKSETVKLTGTFSSTPVAFTVTAYFYVTITAEVL
ncbi:MAG: hypothetical protein JJE09_12650 [Bacteroidia bacterium]|nr:hypothetical protein [Bacteroidia bacterium]